MPRESVYRGFGTFDEPSGGPPRKPGWGVITGLTLAVLMLVGAITISIYYGTTSSPTNGDTAAGGDLPSTTTWTPPPAPEPRIDGWQVGYNRRIQLAYDVPENWNVLPSDQRYSIPELGDMTFRGLVDGPSYQCGGTTLVGGRAVSTRVLAEDTMSRTAEAFFDAAGANFYDPGGDARDISLEPGEPRETTVEGYDAVRLSGTVKLPADGGAKCVPTEATMAVLVVEARDDYVVLVASADSERPAPSPNARGDRIVPRIVESARPVRR
ncbi:hypothetical protein SAMN04487905_104199 [Actinopolyspora xinjiangensis]|uniref:DUF8017 domain-containing protein n=1 Tax=Actinopolyspora xinjiangensis TaxID=405564 RepID=A0A1H0SW76_9ACTN|nr:hypothetical protein [Actinopolyspora xinjiangensis]SDP45879.1 hypothetical protein SAMN04487905_104199 [Actinopolyspora xinjiangensis]